MRKSVLDRRGFLRAAAIGASGAVFSGTNLSLGMARAKSKKPNIIFIMTDDCSRDWLGCYGSKEGVTPNLDKLAEGGMRFETFYVTAICTPTRNMLLTGRYPFRNGWIQHYDVPRWGGQFFDWNREVTFARVVKKSGYSTAIAGKWQINDFRLHPDALQKHGFDEHSLWSGFETGNPLSANRYWDGYIITNGKREVVNYGSDTINDFALDFVERHKDGPFLLYYPMMLTHGGFTTTPHNDHELGRDAEKKPLYKGMVKYADHLIGKLIDKLDELGIREDTLVFYTGDNGSSCGGKAWGHEAENKAKGNGGDLGCHTPLIANWPGVIEAGQVTEELSDSTDMLPTFAELAGAPLPKGVKLDGQSIASLLQGKPGPRREWIYSQVKDKRRIRNKRYILHVDGRFFDLKSDPYEKNDLSGSKDAKIISEKEKLAKVLNSFGPDKPMEGFPPGYRETGKVPALPAGSGKWIETGKGSKEDKDKDKKKNKA